MDDLDEMVGALAWLALLGGLALGWDHVAAWVGRVFVG